MTSLLALALLALLLAACMPWRAEIESGSSDIVQPAAPVVIGSRPLCQVRAATFRGTVEMPCEEVARFVRP